MRQEMATLIIEVDNQEQREIARSFVEAHGEQFDPLFADGFFSIELQISGDDYIILRNLLQQTLLVEVRLWYRDEKNQSHSSM